MSALTKFWQSVRKLRKVGKLNKKLTIPPFSVSTDDDFWSVKFGQNVNSSDYIQKLYTEAQSTTRGHLLAQKFNIDFWLKIDAYDYYDILQIRPEDSAAGEFTIAIITVANNVYGNRLIAKVTTPAFAEVEIVSNNQLDAAVWHHVSFDYDGATLKLYIDGVLQNDTAAQAQPLLAPSAGNGWYVRMGTNAGNNGTIFHGNIDEVRLFSVSRTAAQIQAEMYLALDAVEATAGPYNNTGNPYGMMGYWKLDEGAGFVSLDRITQTDVVLSANVTWENISYPHISGSPKMGAKATITADNKFSITHPVRNTSSLNFALAISYIDPLDSSNVLRYFLWTIDGVNIEDVAGAEMYSGQTIEKSFILEFWGTDEGNLISLDANLDLNVSVLTDATAVDSTTQTDLATVTVDPNIYALTPFNLPLTFNQPLPV